MSTTDETVANSIINAMETAKHLLVDGRYKSMVYTKLEEALALVHVDKIKQQY